MATSILQSRVLTIADTAKPVDLTKFRKSADNKLGLLIRTTGTGVVGITTLTGTDATAAFGAVPGDTANLQYDGIEAGDTKAFILPRDVSAITLINLTALASAIVRLTFVIGTDDELVALLSHPKLSVTLDSEDIEIGAVELKNGADDKRAIIDPANTVRAATDNTLVVQALDAAGVPVSTSAMAAAVHAEDDAHTSGDKGTLMLAVEHDAAGALAANGDYSVVQVSAAGGVKMELEDGATGLQAKVQAANTGRAATDSVLGVQTVDAAGLVEGVSVQAASVVANGKAAMSEAKVVDGAALPNQVTEGQATRAAASLAGVRYAAMTDAAGLQEIPKAVASAPIAGDKGFIAQAVQKTIPTALAADGQYSPTQVDAFGALRVDPPAPSAGFSTYIFDATNSIGHGTTLRTAATQFTLAGASFTPDATQVIEILRFSSAGVLQERITHRDHAITFAAGTYTVAGMSSGAGDLFVVHQRGPERTVDNTTDSQRTGESDPLSLQADLPSEILPLTSLVFGAPANYYYPSAAGMSTKGIKDLAFWIYSASANAVITFEKSMDATFATLIDCTPAGLSEVLGTASHASYSNTLDVIDYFNIVPCYIRVKIAVSTGNTNCRLLVAKKAL